MSGRIYRLDASLEDIGIAEVEELGDRLVLLARNVPDMGVAKEDSNGFVVVDILVLTHQTDLLANLQLVKDLATIAVGKGCDIAAQEVLLVIFNLHVALAILVRRKRQSMTSLQSNSYNGCAFSSSQKLKFSGALLGTRMPSLFDPQTKGLCLE